MTTNPPPLVLASASPRRAELLSRVGYRFETCAAEIDESVRADEVPADYVSRLARAKADAVWESGLVIVASDTCVVAPDGTVLGKPADAGDAIGMLRSLSGRTHSVLTAVCVIGPDGPSSEVLGSARVTFAHVDDATLAGYVAGGEPMDKAGAYALQGQGAALVESIEGDPTTVIGLPLRPTIDALRALGLPPPAFTSDHP